MLILVRPHVSLLDGLVVAAWLPRVGIHRAIFAVDMLDAGRDVVIFPQGTELSIPDRPDMPGCRWLASHTKRRVVKITLDHWDLWPHVTRACLQ